MADQLPERLTHSASRSPGTSANNDGDASLSAFGPVHRKKFATPPVKLACLACRQSRTRCDGNQNGCANCASRGRECTYKPSRRGGARIRKSKQRHFKPTDSEAASGNLELDNSSSSPIDLNVMQTDPSPIPIPSYIDPGAGLAQLQEWPHDSDFIFDSLFSYDGPQAANGYGPSSIDFSAADLMSQPVPLVRAYKSDATLLAAYYVFIHPYLPIMPPPSTTPIDEPIPTFQNHPEQFGAVSESSSPAGLAMGAILALIPCAEDVNHQSPESVLFRRKYAHYLAQAAIEAVEMEDEIPESVSEPSMALSAEPEPTRMPLDPRVPIELEAVIALNLLAVYEYMQRGNLKKMQARASQAMMAATALTLHANIRNDELSEARRRVWWMTYVCLSQAHVLSSTRPVFQLQYHRYITAYPTIKSDPEAFPFFIRSQDAMLSASQFVIDLKEAVRDNADMNTIYEKMKAIERVVEPLQAIADAWVLRSSTTAPVDPTEEVLSRSIRCMAQLKISSARLKLHRYFAFFEKPVFYGKHCDLEPRKALAGQDRLDLEMSQRPDCSCGSLDTLGMTVTPFADPPKPPWGVPTPSDTASDDTDSVTAVVQTVPFNSHSSARVCLKASLDIIKSFQNLPYPNPTGLPALGPVCYLSPLSATVSPRTMPTFACCAMNSAYSLLMVYQKMKATYPDGRGGPMVGTLLGILQAGLGTILATLENYATAFEALGGMRDQVRLAFTNVQSEVSTPSF